MKKILLTFVIVIVALSISFSFIGCKGKMPPINTDFEDVPEDATIATGLSALTLFNEAIDNTYAGDYKRVNVLDFYTDALFGQNQDEVATYYKVGDTYMRTLVVKGEGSVARSNTAIKIFYYNGETAKIAERSGSQLAINFEDVDYSQVANHVSASTDTTERLADYDKLTSYVRTIDKLSETHNDEVYVKGDFYYATIKFDMNVGVVNSGIQEAIDRAVESGTGADANSIEWLEDTVWNCIFIKVGDDFYLYKTYLYENYKAKQKGIITATCTQSNISNFYYGEDIDVPQNLIELLGMAE